MRKRNRSGSVRGCLLLAALLGLADTSHGESSDEVAPGLVRVQDTVKERPPALFVGQIFMQGNEKTRNNVILEQVGLYAGQILELSDLKKAEENLIHLDRFVVDPKKGVRPTVVVLENPNDPNSEYKDIVVTVKEKTSTSLISRLRCDVNYWGILIDVGTPIVFPPLSIYNFFNASCW